MEGLIKVRGGKPASIGVELNGRRRHPRRVNPVIRHPRRIRPVRRSARSTRPDWTLIGAGSVASTWPVDFYWSGWNRGEFYRWMRDTIPVISAGVWAWVRLCTTQVIREVDGSASERERATRILSELDRRILEMPYGRGSGLTKLTEAYFLELFTTGRFAGEAVLTEDAGSIDHFRFIDPYRVTWIHTEKGWTPYIDDDEIRLSDSGARQRLNGERREPSAESQVPIAESLEVNPEHFFYGTLGTDLTNPAGIEPLASIPFVAEIEQLMLEDMARSSHNAGTPRLQIKVNRPERFSWEGDREYTSRANSYFQDVVKEFQNLEPDENIFTWGDVEVAVIGGEGLKWGWRLNREQVIEDVITGLKLYPWVLGRTQKATHQWVQSQFDLLMQMVEAHRKSGADLADWLCNLELGLHKVEARVRHRFVSLPDPFRLERARGERVEIENIDLKVRRGYISKDQGARKLGYTEAFRQDDKE